MAANGYDRGAGQTQKFARLETGQISMHTVRMSIPFPESIWEIYGEFLPGSLTCLIFRHVSGMVTVSKTGKNSFVGAECRE